ncbi:hypothetical protein [Tuwongella immobilis]|uniref:Glycosyltransferase RgtA/B/C/D-like domain-containing protein n=1 Tax=Tuwongella immobilis TaxID=692036 RepID=A0A6C2YUT2_9BACT|nr:hypothetical protein [Tuwongella immobilis]VIP05151.1 Uncharacterized protein OS=Singulisphaera acidiphila (strain ATCC BAA-1392 / DSM 18658 / VKM B-2454 / MOB10) GN=Sinac_5932 PE=4 SV=1 [Tuwongella immobilis]VTS07658.1 Uncharacterized protein OS=Singulisphaera acidiphila (strain ATCC BAA-1392 / DSM 18658 / VKM B-2454 / MOB10) GN=Sinac_5932 PE=4 SV=1 [Tuwongella immobilis]
MDDCVIRGFRHRPWWLLAVVALVLAQAWLTLRLFGADHEWARLTDARPILTGQHPLHLYHGYLGAESWLHHGTSCCYDPAFQAGYPKTPIFDAGSRPAECFMLLGGAKFRPGAYKVGLATGLILVPVAFIVMARGYGLAPPIATLAGLLGMLLGWAAPARGLIIRGDVDLLLGGICMLTHLAWLIRFDRLPGIDSWIMITVLGTLGWFTQPLLWLAYLFFASLYYLWVAGRQPLPWHLAIWGAAILGLCANAFWLWDWLRYWWIRMPSGSAMMAFPEWSALLPDRAMLTQLWHAQPIALTITAIGIFGMKLMFWRKNYASAALLAVLMFHLLVMIRLAMVWPVAGEIGVEALLAIIAWACVCPASLLICRMLRRVMGTGQRPLVVGAVGLVGLALSLSWFGPIEDRLDRSRLGPPRLEIGFDPDRLQLIQQLQALTNTDARILWEDRPLLNRQSGWTALLPQLTQRAFLGGLDSEGQVEHMFARMNQDRLGDRDLSEWTNQELMQFCDRYNVGWVICWTPRTLARWREFPHAREVATLRDRGTGVMFAIQRQPSFILRGKAKWAQADWRRIALTDVEPDENGEIVLSLHDQTGWRVAPSYVRLDRELDPYDPIPLVRLKIPGPIAVLTLTWDNP